jgi:hypothetical protein
MEARSTTYDENRLITFGEYKTFFTRGSDSNFVDDTKDMFNYDNIDLVNGVPNFNKVICTKDFINPADFNVFGNTLPTDTSKCLRNIDVDNILDGKTTFHISVTQSDTSTYFKIVLIEGNLANSKIYNSLTKCYLRIRVELDNEPFDLNLSYLKIYTSETSYYTYFGWTNLVGIFNNIKITGISCYRDGDNSDTKDFIHIPYVYVYIGSGTNLTWIDNTGTQAEYMSEYGGITDNDIPSSGSGSGSGSGSEGTIPSNALVVQINWYTPSYLYQYDTEAIIYGRLVKNDNGNYHLLTYKNEQKNSTNQVYFTDIGIESVAVPGLFYAFNARGNGANSATRISIYGIVSGGYQYLYNRDGKLYDTNFNVVG